MPGKIIANRPEVSRSFAVLGFTVRTGLSPSWFEVALATDPQLFRQEARPQRTPANFFSTRAMGPLSAERGEAVYLVPAEVLDRFVGQPRLYYMLATFRQSDQRDPEIAWSGVDVAPYVTISKSFNGSPRRQLSASSRGTNGAAYASQGNAMEWAGDQASAGQMEPVAVSPAAAGRQVRSAIAAPPPVNGMPPSGVSAAAGYDIPYDDGLDTGLWRMLEENQAVQSQDSRYGIDGPLPDAAPTSAGLAYSRSLQAPEYPQASRFEPADPHNYRATSGARRIDQIVIHITDGGRVINGPISWFKNPSAQVSAHYIVGQDGEVVQMVHHDDVAWHAHTANGHSIGIEHVANTRGLMPTEAQYCASAALVTWLCDLFGLPLDRANILGHAEADPTTTHQSCPNAVWDWNYYMGLVTSRSCYPLPQALGVAYSQGYRPAGQPAAPVNRGNGNGNGSGRGYAALSGIAGALSEVELIYRPADGADALGLIQEFNNRLQSWRVGVPDTSIYPHSAICQLVLHTPGHIYTGTGFYISNDRILTAAHNLTDATSVDVIPGLNGTQRPIPQFSVTSERWYIHPRFNGSNDYDLAVLLVGTPPQQGSFDRLDELSQSLPSPIVVCGYGGETVDPDKQHMDADMIREVTDNTFRYNLQTQQGNSGSPVFYVWAEEDEERQMTSLRTIVVGVHVARHDNNLNEGCRLTQEKIQWILSVGGMVGAQSMSYRPAARRPAARVVPFSEEIPLDPGTGGQSISANALAVGDIIVSTTAETISEIIRRTSDAPVSHAMLYIGDGLVVEAIGSGVVLRPLEDAIRAATLAVAFRVQGLNEEQIMLARDFAGQQVGRPYNYWGIVRMSGYILDRATWCSGKSGEEYERCVNWVGRVNLGKGSDDSFFCSQLVLDAYQHAGVTLTRTPPHWNNPGDIADLRLDGRLGYVGHLKAEIITSQGLGENGNGHGRTQVRALNEIAAAVIGTVVTRIIDNEGDVRWELEQMRGMKHVQDNPQNVGPGPIQDQIIPINGPHASTMAGVDEIYADFEVNFQSDGRSVGNVRITPVRTNDAIGAGLNVRAIFMDDNRAYTLPPGTSTFAGLKLQFQYRFTNPIWEDLLSVTDITLYGNGSYAIQYRWTQ